MTIPSNPSEVSYAGDGISTVLPVPFVFDTSSDLLIKQQTAGVISTITTGFIVTGGGGETGQVTFLVAPATGTNTWIFDNPAVTQPTDYIDNDSFPAESHERALDRVTRIVKRLTHQMGRKIGFPDGDTQTNGDLADIETRKGKYLFFDAISGAMTYALDIVGSALTQPIFDGFLEDSTQAIIGALLYPRTSAEIAAGVTPTMYQYPELNTLRYGSDPSGAADSAAAINNAVLVANSYNSPTGGSCRILIPGGMCRIDSTIQMPQREHTEMAFEGDIDVSDMSAGDILFDFFACSYQTLRFHVVRDVGRRIDAIAMRFGVNNQCFFSRIEACRYGIVFYNNGDGAHSKVENQFYFSVILQCTKGIYFPNPAIGDATDACEGAQFWGGFVCASVEHGVLIEPNVNANYGFITGAIDGFTVGLDYVNGSPTSGWTLMLKFMQNPAFYTLGPADALYNSQVSGVDLRGPVGGAFPALSVDQSFAGAFALAAGGTVCATFDSGGTANVQQGILVGNDKSFATSSAVGLDLGYMPGTSAGAASSGFVRSIHRNAADTFVTLGAGALFTRRAASDVSDIFFVDSASATMAKLYGERNSIQIPVAKTPASAAAAGEVGQIAWDSGFLYVCVAANTWKRVAIATF